MNNVHISKLWRIQNSSLYAYYSFHKARLMSNNIDHGERGVWHGTSSLDPSVIFEDKMDGFMMQFAANGFWGRGLYFARTRPSTLLITRSSHRRPRSCHR